MLNIYYGRNNLNLEKFVYDNIGNDAYVVVPDQYKLTAEKQALKYLKKESMVDIEITDLFGLGKRLIKGQMIEMPQVIDKYGRHMLQGRVIKDNKEQLKAFKGISEKEAFIDLISDFISEFKQNGGTKELLDEIQGVDNSLKDKIEDIKIVLQEYERILDGVYLDNEDFIKKYVTAILSSDVISDKEVWFYGFESMTAIMTDLINELTKKSKIVNIVLSYDEDSDNRQFELTSKLINKLRKQNEILSYEKVDDEYKIEKADDLMLLEEYLFNESVVGLEKNSLGNIDIIEATNPYYEAETIACKIYNMIRVDGYRLKDIAIICNDLEKMGSVLERAFQEYGITLFHDKTKVITTSPIIHFIINQLEFVRRKYNSDCIFSMLKTNLSGLERDDIEIFENYAKKYDIKGNTWKKSIKYGSFEYTENELAYLEKLRTQIINPFIKLEEIIKTSSTYKEFVVSYYKYLVNELNLIERIKSLSEEQKNSGYLEEALETKQILNVAFEIMNQLVEVLGEEEFDLDRFIETYLIGLKYAEIGTIPPKVDEIVMGTNQRTRLGDVKVLIMVGVNEGILPNEPSANNLLSTEEKKLVYKDGYEIGKDEENLLLEEMAAIYRNTSKAKEKLVFSYSLSDDAGNDLKPSSLIEEIKSVFSEIKINKDIVNDDNDFNLINGRISTLRHLTENIQSSKDKKLWANVYSWYNKYEKAKIEQMIKGLCEDNIKESLSGELSTKLFSKNSKFSFSPSRLEKYAKCPFEHYVSYGLKPKELRTYKSEGREIGDIYHECLMRLAKELTEEGVLITQQNSKWLNIKKEECDKLVNDIVENLANEYRDGLLKSTKREEYRLNRIKKICKEAAWNMVIQMRCSDVKEAYFEESFGQNGNIKPILFKVNDKDIYIEGKIDRYDLLMSNSVRVIDYKTGNEKFDKNQVKKGYRLQLMLYLKAAKEDLHNTAGVFYFLIKENTFKADENTNDDLEASIQKSVKQAYRLDGLFVEDETIINELVNSANYDEHEPSNIIKVRYDKKTGKWIPSSSSSSLSKEDFESLENSAVKAAKEISENIIKGDIEIKPAKLTTGSKLLECTYCKYKGICKFDLDFEGNKYNYI